MRLNPLLLDSRRFSTDIRWNDNIESIDAFFARNVCSVCRARQFFSPASNLRINTSSLCPRIGYYCHIWSAVCDMYLKIIDEIQYLSCHPYWPGISSSVLFNNWYFLVVTPLCRDPSQYSWSNSNRCFNFDMSVSTRFFLLVLLHGSGDISKPVSLFAYPSKCFLKHSRPNQEIIPKYYFKLRTKQKHVFRIRKRYQKYHGYIMRKESIQNIALTGNA